MEKIVTLKADEITTVIAQNRGMLFVHFGSPLASSCEVVHKILDELAPEFAGRIRFAELELPLQDLELIRRFSIETIPTLVLFRGDTEVERLEQLMQESDLRDLLRMAASYYAVADSESQSPQDRL